GTSQAVRSIVPSLHKLGVASEVVCLDDPNALFLKNDLFQVQALGPAKGLWSYGAQLIPWLRNNLQRFEIVIVHGLWLYHGYAASKSILRLKSENTNATPKFFVMPHGMLDPYFQQAPERRLK